MIVIGRLTRPHGLKGEMVFLPAVEDLDLLPELTGLRVTLCSRSGAARQQQTIRAWRRMHKRVLLYLEGCQTLEQAEAFRDRQVFIPRASFAPLPEGEYYWFDIEGLTVYASDARNLGVVTDIIYTGSNEVYVVHDGTHEVLIPALKDVVRCIDLARGEIHLFAVPGLLD